MHIVLVQKGAAHQPEEPIQLPIHLGAPRPAKCPVNLLVIDVRGMSSLCRAAAFSGDVDDEGNM